MNTILYKVKKHDSLLSICEKFNITIEQFVNANAVLHNEVRTNPFIIYEDWEILIPYIGNGNNTEYDLD